ncbi:Putative NLP or P60 family protein [Streptomyces venezuelae]|uniref:C40 family peptidase n=1 Tax=Streptomyces gardneri TaxID=66892 RepID=UPI0006BDDA52|nr:C40 family peptidase [Streptomyces gardneri]ALO10300.1 Putative NLP or P60 family protein [Streptomyces venezuelae]QPK47316.1 C40 family peptidase [Streptomyces gardneri]WRK38741.1 C40 family peptidase [Streptomyces venezuelae]CUM39240.1 putative NLP/P60 family protein [Streptomyces venezuelae]
MSHTAHIPSHRKPRRSASKLALRAGVAGGVLGTIAVAGAAGPANAEPVTETIEMPTLGSLDTAGLASAVAASAEASQQEALDQSLESQENAALQKAAKEAKKAKAEADRKAEAERAEKARAEAEAKAKAEQERLEAEARASRDRERTQLRTTSTSDNSSSGSNASDSGSSTGSSDSGSSTGSSNNETQAPSGSAASIVAFARAQVGDAYVRGGTGPNSWDCSGLVQAAYAQAGIDLPRISYDQSSMGTSVSLSNLQPGDILYWGSRSGSYHVAIYVGGGKYVGAQNSSTGVVEHSLDWDTPSGAVRIL